MLMNRFEFHSMRLAGKVVAFVRAFESLDSRPLIGLFNFLNALGNRFPIYADVVVKNSEMAGLIRTDLETVSVS